MFLRKRIEVERNEENFCDDIPSYSNITFLLNLKRFIFTESILRKLQFSFFYFFRYFIQCFGIIDQLMT